MKNYPGRRALKKKPARGKSSTPYVGGCDDTLCRQKPARGATRDGF